MRSWLGIATAGFLVFGSAHASPILVDPTADGSDVSAEITSSMCLDCFIDASISDNLEEAIAWLDTGESFTFDFFDLTIGGLFGVAEFEVSALLALASPETSATSGGLGIFASFLYIFNGVSLTWDQPDAIDLGDGTFLSISFEDLFEFGIGGTTTVSATISRFDAAAVPEPGTAALLMVGLLALWFASRHRPVGRPLFSASAL